MKGITDIDLSKGMDSRRIDDIGSRLDNIASRLDAISCQRANGITRLRQNVVSHAASTSGFRQRAQ